MRQESQVSKTSLLAIMDEAAFKNKYIKYLRLYAR